MKQTLDTLSLRQNLEEMKFRTNCSDIDVTDLDAAKQHPMVCEENQFAAVAGNFAYTLIGCRFRRMAPDLIGWPNSGVGFGSKCDRVRGATICRFNADALAHEDMDARASGDTWDKVKRRSVFKTVPVKQLKRVLDDCNYRELQG